MFKLKKFYNLLLQNVISRIVPKTQYYASQSFPHIIFIKFPHKFQTLLITITSIVFITPWRSILDCMVCFSFMYMLYKKIYSMENYKIFIEFMISQ